MFSSELPEVFDKTTACDTQEQEQVDSMDAKRWAGEEDCVLEQL